MEKLNITDDGEEKKVSYTDRFSKGIFIVKDSKMAKDNCKILNIDLGPEPTELGLSQKVSKIEHAAFLSQRIARQYFRYIILEYVERRFSRLVAPNAKGM